MDQQHDKPDATEHAAAAGGIGGLLMRGKNLVFHHPNIALLVCGAAVTLVSLLLAMEYVQSQKASFAQKQSELDYVSIDKCLEELDAGRFSEANDYSWQLAKQSQSNADMGAAQYVAGTCSARQAEELFEEQQSRLALVAAKHLTLASTLGFPPGREGEGFYLLGRSLLTLDRVTEAQSALERALAAKYEHPLLVNKLLANAYQRGKNPDFERALAANMQVLRDKELSQDDRYTAYYEHAEILWKQHRLNKQKGLDDKAWQTLDKIPQDALVGPDAALLRGIIFANRARGLRRQLLAKKENVTAEQVQEAFESAIDCFRRAQADPIRAKTVRKAMYLMGIVYLDLEKVDEALKKFGQTRNLFPSTHEGLAAGLQEADLLRKAGKDDLAIEAYLRVLGRIPRSRTFTNSWIEAEEFRRRVLLAYQQYVTNQQFGRAVALAEKLGSLISPARAESLLGDTHRDWARSLLSQAETAQNDKVVGLRAEARNQLRLAGSAYAHLAELNYTERSYPDDLRAAAESFLEGHDFYHAAETFRVYLDHEILRRRPRGLVGLGESLLALGQVDEAIEALRECIEFYPTDPVSYRARFLTAIGHMERNEKKAAETLLRDNLEGGQLHPKSPVWQDSLYALGELLAADDRWDEAILRLEEALERDKGAERKAKARYLAGQCYRRSALQIQKKLAADTTETSKAAHRTQIRERLTHAIEHFETLRNELLTQQEQRDLTPREHALLRNSYFVEGTSLVDMGDSESIQKAILVYSAATGRFQRDPEVLEAFVQIAQCNRILKNVDEARGSLRQARVILGRIPAEKDAAFNTATNYTRKQWGDLLDWLANL